jgi:transposase
VSKINPRRKKYTTEFKNQAVKLVLEQGYTQSEAARSLGVSLTNINRWIIGQENGSIKAQKKSERISAEQSELEALWKENKRLRMEREILKKAAAFFAKETQ